VQENIPIFQTLSFINKGEGGDIAAVFGGIFKQIKTIITAFAGDIPV